MAQKPQSIYGIDSVKFMPAILSGELAGTLPDFDTLTGGIELKAIAKDSVQLNTTEPGKTDIEIEGQWAPYVTITTGVKKNTITITTYDYSAEVMKYFLGYTEQEVGGKTVLAENPNFQMKNQAIELVSLEMDGHPARKTYFANTEVEVVEGGTYGRGGLATLQITITAVANYDKDGKLIPNKSVQILAESTTTGE